MEKTNKQDLSPVEHHLGVLRVSLGGAAQRADQRAAPPERHKSGHKRVSVPRAAGALFEGNAIARRARIVR
jgi:hypothetical protein